MRFSHLNWPLSPVETLTSLEVNRRSSSLISSGFLFFNKMILLMLLVVTFPFEILRTHPAPVFLHQERHLESMLRWLTIFPSILDSSLLSGRNHLRIENIWNNKDTVTSRVGGTIWKLVGIILKVGDVTVFVGRCFDLSMAC